jgi:microcystin-dependent protein
MEPQIGQIVLCAFTSTMYTFLPCDGSQQPDYEYEVLGTLLGPNSSNNFTLPNLSLPSPLGTANASWQICALGASPPYQSSSNSALVGEIDLFATGPNTFQGTGYVPCNGSTITMNSPYSTEVLFAEIGTTFGGNFAAFDVPTLAPPQGTNLPSGLGYGICVSGAAPPGPAAASIIGTVQLLPVISGGSGLTWPSSYIPCNGQQIAIGNYPALYTVIGTTFGSGATTFGVPNISAPANMMWTIAANGVMPSFANEAT